MLNMVEPLPYNCKDCSWFEEDITSEPVITADPEKGNPTASRACDAVKAYELDTAFKAYEAV